MTSAKSPLLRHRSSQQSEPSFPGSVLLHRESEEIEPWEQDSWQQFVFCGEAVVMGYLLHFATFFPLERTLFIHHYLPALFFKIVLFPVMLQHVHQEIFRYKVLRQMLYGCCALLVVVVLWGFHFYSPFTYGHVALSSAEINRRKWLKTWDMLSHPNT